MSESSDRKRYYWLKLPETFFDDETIKYIEEFPNGVAYTNFYLKLCLKSVQNKGLLSGANDLKFLSNLTNLDAEIVKEAMSVLSDIGLIEIRNGIIHIPWAKRMGESESSAAKRMRKMRKSHRVGFCVYKYYDADGNLLYIGKTEWPYQRYIAHCQKEEWTNDVQYIEVAVLSSEDEASEAERNLIAKYKPVENNTFKDRFSAKEFKEPHFNKYNLNEFRKAYAEGNVVL